MAEQDILLGMRDLAPFFLYGGYDGAERRIACFGSEDEFGFASEPPCVCIAVEPLSLKFAEKLTHRDFLGALMSLGIRRETLGDIVIIENRTFIFCLSQIAEYLMGELHEVRRTSVKCSISDIPPELAAKEPEDRELVVPSERADALVAAVYRLSRSGAQELFAQKRIYLNSRTLENTSKELSEGDIISVRGHGRFVFRGAVRETKKGRLRVLVGVF